jgi:hypothetical protein
MNAENKNIPEKKNKPPPIPNNLNITINTSVPGFQTLKYKPNMTIPDISKDDNAVMFNPLVKLNKNVISRVPENLRVKEFFNRGLFDSLINLHGLQKIPSLAQATYDGYVDHNIFVTLQELFPINGLIYINKQPFRIGDIQWRKGEWRVAQKFIDLPQLDASKIQDPFLFQAVVRDEIISGEEQLSNLPDNVVFGPNYNVDQDPTATGRPKTENAKQQEQQLLLTGPLQSSATQEEKYEEEKKPQGKPRLAIEYAPTKSDITPPTSNVPQIMPPTTSQPESKVPRIMPPPATTLPSKNLLQIEAAPNPIVENPIVEELEEDNTPMPEPNLQKSPRSSQQLRDYFGSNKYYYMINEMYKNMDANGKGLIIRIFKQTTEIEVKQNTKNLSKDAYNDTYKNLFVYANPGGGNCFFCAVAQGINLHNYNNPNKKITYYKSDKQLYGIGDKIFTSDVLRGIVSTYIYNNYERDEIYNMAISNLDELNKIFRNTIKVLGSITDDEYKKLLDDIYDSNDNFLVKKPIDIATILDKNNPYSLISKEESSDYIKTSKYWGDQLAIYALIDQLKIYTIIIERRKNGTFTISNPMFALDVSGNEVLNNDHNKLVNQWKYFMFIYFNESHYELISFDYKYHEKFFNTDRQFITQNKIKKYALFDVKDGAYPTFYMMYLIFATAYINKEEQEWYAFYPKTFDELKKTFNKIYERYKITMDNPTKSDETKFFIYFKQYFSDFLSGNFKKSYPELSKITYVSIELNPRRIESKKRKAKKTNVTRKNRSPSLQSSLGSEQAGGQGQALITPYRPAATPYRPITQPATQQTISQIAKAEADKSNIAYYITIDMQLIKGKDPIPSNKMAGLKCGNKWNSVRRSFAELTGTKYVIPPVYENYPDKDNKK